MALSAAAALAGCGAVEIAPEPIIPKAIVAPLPGKVGVVVSGEQKNFKHDEMRNGVGWEVQLGAGHVRLAKNVFGALFAECVFFDDLGAAKAATGLVAIFEPRMEQYSFATAKETGGAYYAVTIRYRINAFAADGKLADSFTITGYGNSRDQAMSSSEPLAGASRAAMRDAAAKFLVQFPDQPLGVALAKGEKVIAGDSPGGSSNPTETPAMAAMEVVPILEPATPKTASPAPPTPPVGQPDGPKFN